MTSTNRISIRRAGEAAFVVVVILLNSEGAFSSKGDKTDKNVVCECPQGFVQTGYECVRADERTSILECPQGFFNNPDNPDDCLRTTHPSLVCPDPYVNLCTKKTAKECCVSSQEVAPIFVCPPKTEVIDDICVEEFVLQPRFECPPGFEYNKKKECVKVDQIEPTKVCPGFYDDEGNCVQRALGNITRVCPEGYTCTTSGKKSGYCDECVRLEQASLQCTCADGFLDPLKGVCISQLAIDCKKKEKSYHQAGHKGQVGHSLRRLAEVEDASVDESIDFLTGMGKANSEEGHHEKEKIDATSTFCTTQKITKADCSCPDTYSLRCKVGDHKVKKCGVCSRLEYLPPDEICEGYIGSDGQCYINYPVALIDECPLEYSLSCDKAFACTCLRIERASPDEICDEGTLIKDQCIAFKEFRKIPQCPISSSSKCADGDRSCICVESIAIAPVPDCPPGYDYLEEICVSFTPKVQGCPPGYRLNPLDPLLCIREDKVPLSCTKVAKEKDEKVKGKKEKVTKVYTKKIDKDPKVDDGHLY